MITKIIISNHGYVHCRSSFYTVQDVLDERLNYSFSLGINKLIGEIDSGNWAISYLISMYNHRPRDFTIFNPKQAIINEGIVLTVNDLTKHACYMDKINPLFKSKKTVRRLVNQEISKSGITNTAQDIRDIFQIDNKRFEQPLYCVGNEIFKAMSAIAHACDKQIICFPWMSAKRFESYHKNLTELMTILESLNKIVILPIGCK